MLLGLIVNLILLSSIVPKTFLNFLTSGTFNVFSNPTVVSNSEYKISQFEKYDYIGGYWGSQLYEPLDELYPTLKPGGAYAEPYKGPQVLPMNGALSIRNKEVMLDLVKNHFDEYLAAGKPYSEDYFFSEYVTKPTTRDVITFGIDNGYISPLDMKAPFGIHKPWANKGGAWYNIKLVCEGVETLRDLQGVKE